MFKERITALLDALQANVTVIAELADTDPTNISRIKNGSRSYRPNSKTIDRLLDGILVFAKRKQKCDILDQLIDYHDGSRKEALRSWIFQDTDQIDSAKTLSDFPDRLNALIQLAGLSNARLAKLASIDPSYISRLRSGSRIPGSGSAVYETIARVLFHEIIRAGHQETLRSLIQTDAAEHSDEFFQAYETWLTARQKKDAYIETLLASINQVPSPKTFYETLQSLKQASELDISYELRDVYCDSEGLQEASLRFLSEVIRSESREIYLFSEYRTEWMTQDPAFLRLWTSLMLQLVQKGIRIHIIHNIDRSVPEMVDAIKSWLPLYLSGLIEPWYTNVKGGKRFQHTLFICPEVACVSSVHLFGDPHAIFHYDTDSGQIDYCFHLFRGLLEKSLPLMQIEKAESFPEDSAVQPYTEHENIRIFIAPASVTVTRITEPRISFTILNRHLCEAIRAYCE